jgi:hypothetical protein
VRGGAGLGARCEETTGLTLRDALRQRVLAPLVLVRTLTWYGTFAAAVVLAVVAVTGAVVRRNVSAKQGLAIAALALPALVAVPVLVWTVLTVAPLVD